MSEGRRNAPVGVVVGYDGSWSAEVAVTRAADEAVRRRTRLAVASVFPCGEPPPGELRAEEAERSLREVVARVRRRRPGLMVTAHRATGDAAAGLRDVAERAVVLVVGSRGVGSEGVYGATVVPVRRPGPTVPGLGGVARDVLRVAGVPVLVVPETDRPAASHRPPLVVAAVDHDESAGAVLHAALEEAARREGRVRLLHSYAERPTGAALHRARAFSRDLVREVAPGGAAITAVVTPEPTAVALARHAVDADLLAVGVRGPMSRAVTDAVPCNLLVMTSRASRRLVPQPRPAVPSVPRLPSARVPDELVARARARQASPARARP